MESFIQSVIKHKTGLLNLAAELGNISKACRIMGFSRDTFYRYKAARNAGGVEALFEVSRRKPNLKNRVEEATEQAVVEFATAFPAHGQVRASNEPRKRGIFVSPSGVRSIWLRHNLSSMKQRLNALEKMSADQGIVLYLGANGIEHTRAKARHPQTNGICERFHKTILHEFYQVAFRRKLYHSLEELQTDLDVWLEYYNTERTHQGKMCSGRTPLQTLLDGKKLWDEMVGQLN